MINIDGVIIIEELKVLSEKGAIMSVLCILIAVIIALSVLYLGLKLFRNDKLLIKISIMMLNVPIMLIGRFVQNTIEDKHQISSGEYRVVLEKDVDMDMFNQKYEILEYDNNTYTVREKN